VYPNILVFMPSVKHIKEIVAYLKEDRLEEFKSINDAVHFIVQELHGAMKPNEKSRVLRHDPSTKGLVRLIFASKIAETAITIEDIYYVLDSGLEREYFYDETRKMSFIKETKISKSSADQRKGRAGRVANGYCFKMYKQEEELKFQPNKVSEILRMDISDIILAQIKLRGLFLLSDVMYYGAHEHFNVEKLQQVSTELEQLGATAPTERQTVLTRKGEFMLGMSCAALVGAFLFECHKLGVLSQGVIAASTLENIKSFFKESVDFRDAASTQRVRRQRDDRRADPQRPVQCHESRRYLYSDRSLQNLRKQERRPKENFL
jgi:HrpA-like RNA helicase